MPTKTEKSPKAPTDRKATVPSPTELHAPKHLGTPPSEMGNRRPDVPRDDLSPRHK
jgi:hypothetical protein